MNKELEKIGDYPKSTQLMRRKDEISKELMTLNTNINSIKNKIKLV